MAAWLCRRHTEATLRELAKRLGLGRADSVPNLTRRVDSCLQSSDEFAADLAVISRYLECREQHQKSSREKTKNKD